MSKAKHQGDIVTAFLHNEVPNEMKDHLYIPGLQHHFEVIPKNAVEQSTQLNLPGIKKLGNKSRLEIAELLASVRNIHKGVTGFKWEVEDETLEMRYVEGFKQKELQHEREEKDFINLLVMALKSRKNILTLDWTFGEDHIKVRCLTS